MKYLLLTLVIVLTGCDKKPELNRQEINDLRRCYSVGYWFMGKNEYTGVGRTAALAVLNTSEQIDTLQEYFRRKFKFKQVIILGSTAIQASDCEEKK